MKGIELFCASQASTAICLSMDHEASSSSSNTIQLGGRAIDRHNPIIRDSRRIPSSPPPSSSSSSSPSSSKAPIDPKPNNQQPQKAKKSLPLNQSEESKRSSKKKSSRGKLSEQHITNSYCSKPIESVIGRSWVWPPAADLINTTPPSSSRYLLNETSILDGVSDYNDQVLALTPFDDTNNKRKKAQAVFQHQHHPNHHPSKPSSSSLPKPDSSDQVVVLRVSLHCRGCEGKLRKHLSRMKGVTSFNIDFAAKKLTVVGDVTPLSVLSSVSKVKNAQFWPLPANATPAPYEIRK